MLTLGALQVFKFRGVNMIVSKGQVENKFIITISVDTDYLKEITMDENIKIENFTEEEIKKIVLDDLKK